VGKIRTIASAGTCEVCSHHARALTEGVESLPTCSVSQEGTFDNKGRVCGHSPKRRLGRYRQRSDSEQTEIHEQTILRALLRVLTILPHLVAVDRVVGVVRRKGRKNRQATLVVRGGDIKRASFMPRARCC